jgi:NAD(P)-dependent dehydrogenase (short-subunit alcohol dehydrogenase family)
MKEQVWIISGASRGIGKAIAREALCSGHKVAAGVRQLDDVMDLVSEFGEACLPVRMDMTQVDTLESSVNQAVKQWGRVDVLINNAGYGLWGMMEELSMEQIRHQMEVNFFGLVALTRFVVPLMRQQQSGFIANVSSLAGLRGMQGLSAYNASKFAVEGFTEALAQEMAYFKVRVCVVEPGPYRTDWAGNSLVKTPELKALDVNSPYHELNQVAARRIYMSDGKQPGNPVQIAKVLLEAAAAPVVPLHMLFGDVCIEGWEQRKARLSDPEFMSYYPHEKNTL